jgi:hypothetical protein
MDNGSAAARAAAAGDAVTGTAAATADSGRPGCDAARAVALSVAVVALSADVDGEDLARGDRHDGGDGAAEATRSAGRASAGVTARSAAGANGVDDDAGDRGRHRERLVGREVAEVDESAGGGGGSARSRG